LPRSHERRPQQPVIEELQLALLGDFVDPTPIVVTGGDDPEDLLVRPAAVTLNDAIEDALRRLQSERRIVIQVASSERRATVTQLIDAWLRRPTQRDDGGHFEVTDLVAVCESGRREAVTLRVTYVADIATEFQSDIRRD
jgi:hypothetical protein